jgi:DNA repair ATPase RecN
MTDTKMLQLIVTKLSSLEVKLDSFHKEFTEKIEALDAKLTKRIDRLGYDLSNLDDDTPTRSEYKKLEKRVSRLEKSSLTS